MSKKVWIRVVSSPPQVGRKTNMNKVLLNIIPLFSTVRCSRCSGGPVQMCSDGSNGSKWVHMGPWIQMGPIRFTWFWLATLGPKASSRVQMRPDGSG